DRLTAGVGEGMSCDAKTPRICSAPRRKARRAARYPGNEWRLVLSRADLGEEAVDGVAQHARLVVEFSSIGQHFGRRRAGGRGRRGHAADMGADLVRARRDLLDVAGDLARRAALLLDRARDVGGDLAHL